MNYKETDPEDTYDHEVVKMKRSFHLEACHDHDHRMYEVGAVSQSTEWLEETTGEQRVNTPCRNQFQFVKLYLLLRVYKKLS